MNVAQYRLSVVPRHWRVGRLLNCHGHLVQDSTVGEVQRIYSADFDPLLRLTLTRSAAGWSDQCEDNVEMGLPAKVGSFDPSMHHVFQSLINILVSQPVLRHSSFFSSRSPRISRRIGSGPLVLCRLGGG